MSNILLILLAGVFNGVGDFFSKLTAGKLSPYVGGIMISLFSGLTVAAYLVFIKGVQGNVQYTKLGLLYGALGGIAIGIGVIFFFTMFSRGINISQAQPIVKTMVILTAVLLGVLVLREKMSLMQVAGFILSLLGIYLVMK